MKQRLKQSETNGCKQTQKSRALAKLWGHSENEMIPAPAFEPRRLQRRFSKGDPPEPTGWGGGVLPPGSSLYKRAERVD